AEIMNSPSSAASQRYSGQCSRSARITIDRLQPFASPLPQVERRNRSHLQTGRCSRPHSFDVQSHPIKSTLRAEVERLPIGIAPREIVRVLWRNNCAEMFALRRENP